MAGRYYESFGHVTDATGSRKFQGYLYMTSITSTTGMTSTPPSGSAIAPTGGWDSKGALTTGMAQGIRVYPGAMGALPAARSQWFVGYRAKHSDTGVYPNLFSFKKTDTVCGYFQVNSNGTVSYYAYAGGSASETLVATSTYALNMGVRYYLVFNPIIGENGSCALRVDGTEILSAAQTTADNRGRLETVTDCDTFDILTAGTGEIDDVVVWDTSTTDAWGNPDPLYTWVGDLRVYPLSPVTPDTAQTDFTPSTGSDNFAMVDEKALSDADYVSSTIVGHQDLYNMEDLTGTVGAIYGVQLNVCAQKDQPDTRTLKGQILPGDGGATVQDGDTHTLTTAWKIHRDIWGSNPADDAVWEEADVNAVQTGFSVVA